jgi:ribose transport system ATP-binding protein
VTAEETFMTDTQLPDDPSLEQSAEGARSGWPEASEALRLEGVSKSFPGVRALSDVSLTARAGEVHALVGENGAGKSTLMAIASGALAADSGTVIIGGQVLREPSPERAREYGLGIVRQDPALLPDLTVAENMAIAIGLKRVGGLGRAVTWAQQRLDPWEMGIDARSRVADLAVDQRFVVEISKALALEPRVLILDEPTEHLGQEETDRLFARIRQETAKGAAVVYISHRIPQVRMIADRITVLRDGQARGTFDASAVDEQQIVERIIGRSLDAVFPVKGSVAGSVGDADLLEVSALSGSRLHDISFSVKAGEIVGIAGVQGNGQAELLRALAGLEPVRGTVRIAGGTVPSGSSYAAARAGAAYIPADRHGEGIFPPLPLSENIVAGTLPAASTAGVVSDRRVTVIAREQIRRLSIRAASHRTAIASLSGGNQQKAVMARTLLTRPKVLLAEEPTQGVDAGARVNIYQILREAADGGAAVVLLSSDGVELEGLCDRVLIMSRGRIVAELSGPDVAEEHITRAAVTAVTADSAVEHRAGPGDGGPRLRRFLRGDNSPAAILAVFFLAFGIAITASNPDYLSGFNVSNLLFAVAPLIFVGAAQQVVVLGSGFDLSVGSLMGFIVVIASFWITDDGSAGLGFVMVILAAAGVGLVNGLLIARLNINPIVMTLAMSMGLEGVYLALRSTPGGTISSAVTDAIEEQAGAVPVAVIVAIVVVLALEWLVRRTRWGVELRATGSRPEAAAQLGLRVRNVRLLSYVAGALLVLPAGLLLMAQVGIGDGSTGQTYTLSSVTIVVLAGASIFGGRGSFIGIIAAALFVEEVLSASTFLGLSQAWAYWLPGGITLGAAVLYAQFRRTRRTR